jgi:hypothetical protein
MRKSEREREGEEWRGCNWTGEKRKEREGTDIYRYIYIVSFVGMCLYVCVGGCE